MTVIRPATTPEDLAAVRALFWDYRAHLMANSETDAEITRTFYPAPKYTALMDQLAQLHARPRGIILLAELAGRPAGCAMTQPLDATTAEVKRLFVAPHARGHGIARDLMRALEARARDDGFARMVLDTSRNLHAARALYAALGYVARGPYQAIPEQVLPHLLFFEKGLNPAARAK